MVGPHVSDFWMGTLCIYYKVYRKAVWCWTSFSLTGISLTSHYCEVYRRIPLMHHTAVSHLGAHCTHYSLWQPLNGMCEPSDFREYHQNVIVSFYLLRVCYRGKNCIYRYIGKMTNTPRFGLP